MDALLNHLWQSTVFAGLAAILAWYLRRERAAVRYWIWLAASVKFLVPLSVLVRVGEAIAPAVGAPAAGAIVPHSLAVLVSPATVAPSTPGLVAGVLLAVWACGCVAMLLSLAADVRRIRRVVRYASAVTGGPVYDALTRLAPGPREQPRVTLLEAATAVEPAITGVFRPILIWPSPLTMRLSVDEIEAVVAHEIAHVRRGDHLLGLVHAMVASLFWFHPVVWWIGARLTVERERACDESVLDGARTPHVYAGAILRTCEMCVASRTVVAPAVSGGSLKDRVAQILGYEHRLPLPRARRIALAGCAAAALVLPVVWGACAARPVRVDSIASAQEKQRIVVPKLKKEVKAQYPPSALPSKTNGEVLMTCVVRTNGLPTDIRVVKSLSPEFDRAAVRALEGWEFEPGRKDGRPVPVQVTITVSFTTK